MLKHKIIKKVDITYKFIFLSISLMLFVFGNIGVHAAISSDSQEKVIESQIKILTSPQSSLETRQIAAGLLIDLNTKESIERVKQLLDESPDNQCKLAIIQAIADRDEPPAIFADSLIKILLGNNPELQQAVSMALGRYRDEKLLKKLIEIAKDVNKPINQRLAAIKTLGYTRTKLAVGTLISLMEKTGNTGPDNQAITSACAVSLYQLTRMNFGTQINKWKKWWARIKSKSPLQWLETQLDLLIKENRKLMGKLNQTEQELIDATVELFRLLPQTEADKIKFLQSRLTNNTSADKMAAIAILHTMIVQGQPIPSQLMPAIRNLISDEDYKVRLACAKLLQETNDKSAISSLVAQLEKEPNPIVKQNILIALGNIGDAKLLDTLIEQLNSPLESVSSGAAQAIAQIFQTHKVGKKLRSKTIEALLNRYKNLLPQHAQLKVELLHTMAIIADKKFLDIFKRALQSPIAGLRLDAVRGLTSIGDESVVELLLNNLNDSEPGVRAKIASGIADITSDPRAVEILMSRINPNIEKDVQVRQATWNAILVMIKRWPFEKQLKWARQLPMRSDKISDEQMLELVELLSSQVADVASNWPARQKIDTLIAFGDLLMSTQLPAEAIKYYRQAIITSKQALPKESLDLTEKILNKLLGSSKDGIAEAQFINDMSGILDKKQFARVVDIFLAWATKSGHIKAARNIIRHLPKQLIKSFTDKQRASVEGILKKISSSRPVSATKPVTKPATKPAA